MRRETIVIAAFFVFGVLGCQQQAQGTKATPPPKAETAAAAPAADAKPADDGGEVVATFSGNRLTSARVLKEMERLPAPSRAYLQAPDRKRQFVDNMILNDLLYNEGQKLGYDKDDDIDRQVNDLRRRLVVQRVVSEFQKPPEISDEQAKAYYDEQQHLDSTARMRMRDLLM